MNRYIRGMKDGIPIALGYVSVSFTFGLMAISHDFTWWEATIISMTNLTSAGQFAGLGIMIAGGPLIEMAITQFVINLRYALMSLSLSQKVDESITGIYRWLIGFGITDEIFAVAMNHEKQVCKTYMFGLITIPYIGWAMGTFLGAILGNVLPESVCSALGVAIYGMFIAIIIPPMKSEKSFLYIVIFAVVLSCFFAWTPGFKQISSGFAIIICAILASVVGAVIFPVSEKIMEECD